MPFVVRPTDPSNNDGNRSQLEQTVNELEAAAVQMKDVDDEEDVNFDEVSESLNKCSVSWVGWWIDWRCHWLLVSTGALPSRV